MPGVNSTSASRYESGWEMDYDRYQHYFYDDHDPDEDFSKSTAPSEDIWKKFELVPTPPMSPIWTLDGAAGVGVVHPSLGDKLEWVSQFLGQEDDHDVPCKLSSADEALGNLSSIIVRDCMWSGFSAGKQLEKVVGERLASCPVSGPTKLPVQALGAAIITAAGRAQCAAVPVDAAVPVLGSLATDCVDPAAVLAFPLTGGTFKKPSVSSGSETHTDSSDDESSDHDDDDDDDGDEEEIDVVTVEHKQYKPRRVVNGRVTGGRGGGLNRRTPVTIMVRADPLNPCMKRFHISIHQQHHNYAAPSPDTHPDTHTAPNLPRKRVRHEPPNSSHSFSNFTHTQPHHHPASTSNQTSESKPHVAIATIGSESSDANTPSLCGSPSASPRLSSSHPCSPQSSDYEDTDKRKTHNFLERKRRNDLRSRFLTLRDEIPGLAECSKTPKVAILMRATEYLGQLHSSERQRAQEKRQLKARQQQLLRRLAQLKQRP